MWDLDEKRQRAARYASHTQGPSSPCREEPCSENAHKKDRRWWVAMVRDTVLPLLALELVSVTRLYHWRFPYYGYAKRHRPLLEALTEGGFGLRALALGAT